MLDDGTLWNFTKRQEKRASATTAGHSVSRSFCLRWEFSDDRQCKPDRTHASCHSLRLLFIELISVVFMVALLTTQHLRGQQNSKILDRWCNMGARAALENYSVEFTSGFVLGCLLIDVYIHALFTFVWNEVRIKFDSCRPQSSKLYFVVQEVAFFLCVKHSN